MHSTIRPNVKLTNLPPPSALEPEPFSDKIGAVAWWIMLVLTAGFWYLVASWIGLVA